MKDYFFEDLKAIRGKSKPRCSRRYSKDLFDLHIKQDKHIEIFIIQQWDTQKPLYDGNIFRPKALARFIRKRERAST